jgi:phosphotriesterase-related protein
VAPRWRFRHISEDVLPALKARGLFDDDVDTLLVANPRRLFE